MDILTPEGRFQYCIKVILDHEGGLDDDKHDSGGITNYGISYQFAKPLGFTVDDIKNLTSEQAIEIYRKHWWNKYYYSGFNELDVVAKVFDMAVNFGAITGHMILQKSINNLSKIPITVDGEIGGKTLSAANNLDGSKLREMMRILSKQRYLNIIKRNPNLERFKKGWLIRAAW